MTTDPFPLSRWLGPSTTGVGRLPMAGAADPFDDADEARRGESSWVRSLDGDWQFREFANPDDIGPAEVGGESANEGEPWSVVLVPGAWPLQRDDSRARPIYLNVRMPFGGHPPSVPEDNPTGVYRRTFTVAARWRRRRTLLRVGAANSMGFVWVNGRFAGFGTDSHLASTYDVSALLRPGENDVTIVVPRWSAATWIEDQDQWWLPGLHRSVELLSVPRPVSIADAALVPGLAVDGTTGTLDVDIALDVPADTLDPGEYQVAIVVEPLDVRLGARPKRLATTTITVPRWIEGEPDRHRIAYTWPGHRARGRVEVPGIVAWNHEQPQRYRAIVELRDAAGTVVDVSTKLVGFRRVEIADRRLLINGIAVVINGVNHHDIHPDTGPVVSVDDLRRDLELMKRHHVNAVRTSHYPSREALYDLCDELGLYVVDEANIESHARWRSVAEDPQYAAAMLERGMRMVLRDRSHPCVIAWSLGNESGYGASHDAMAAWIRRVDPSRPTHYEGGFSLDLDAASPASDIVCPMYASVDRIVRWSREGGVGGASRDRRPLILCEYNHAMGQAGGLADYWAVFGVEDGLQGGFVWEWADHGLRRRGVDGITEWFAYGGDFGEIDHDGTFVCDGLVSPDRVPHPLLLELAALTQPVAGERLGDGRLRITNRRWFTDLSDLQARWKLAIDGEKVAGWSALELPPIAPQSSVIIDSPAPSPGRPGRATLTVRFAPARGKRPAWASEDWEPALCIVDVPNGEPDRRRHQVSRPVVPIDVHDDALGVEGMSVASPSLSLWRPPTDNDDPPGTAWAGSAAARWRAQGLDRMAEPDDEVLTRRGATVSRDRRYRLATGEVVGHRQRIRRLPDGSVQFDERVDIPRSLTDIPRVGILLVLPPDFDHLSWLGRGPGDSYPDRHAATRHGRWTASVGDVQVPFVVPQEYGLHLDTEWFELSTGSLTLRIAGDRPLAFSALPHGPDALTAAGHAHELPPRQATWVHLDVAHRGLGTAACGPDTHDRWKIHGGRYRFTWTLGATTTDV
ncbi:glycoside hydrolase family 2 TIM barrel-domain containing protein [Desertimonas flava]|uniref:glycoside hydrolase family 2 TIM barrel-domain containing protein n=1 Tax=Desertimonas flava TaxID=2064846 RepID=UPI0023F013DB|nr:glycoside hydrolase family 2 TIM barrel-domain containing protein [Desertimonas flava]